MWLFGAIVAMALLAILAGRIFQERGWVGYLRLMRHGANCEALIIRTEPQGNCLTEYTFSIGGHSYHGTGSECSARVGQKVIITYLVADPSQSCLGHAGETLANEVVSFLFGRLTFPPLS